MLPLLGCCCLMLLRSLLVALLLLVVMLLLVLRLVVMIVMSTTSALSVALMLEWLALVAWAVLTMTAMSIRIRVFLF